MHSSHLFYLSEEVTRFFKDNNNSDVHNWYIIQGPLYKNERNTPKISFFEITILPRGWMEVCFSDYSLIILKKWYLWLGVKKFLGSLELSLKLFKHGHFLMNFRFWLLWVELRKTITLNFLQRYKEYQIGSCPQVLHICIRKYHKTIKKIFGLESPLPCNWQIWVFRPYLQRSLY